MRTTLDLPDELFRQLKARAALLGTSVKELLTSYVESGDAWERFAITGRLSPNLWTDDYLAAFAVRSGLRLVSFDKGFSRFDGLAPLTLEK